jgi:hypothetical protein
MARNTRLISARARHTQSRAASLAAGQTAQAKKRKAHSLVQAKAKLTSRGLPLKPRRKGSMGR